MVSATSVTLAPGHGLGRGPLGKQLGRHLVDLRVGRLSREQYRDEQPKGILVVQESTSTGP